MVLPRRPRRLLTPQTVEPEKSLEHSEEKAWALLRKLLNDDEKFWTLKIKGEPIDVKGSEGGRYILYPNALVVSVGKEKALIGNARNSSSIAHPDVLSTLYVWITEREDEFKARWGCGSLDVFYAAGSQEEAEEMERIVGRIRPDLNDAERQLMIQRFREVTEMRRERDWSSTAIFGAKLLFMFLFPLMIFWTASNIFPAVMNTMNSTNTTALNANLFSKVSGVMSWILPLVIAGATVAFFVHVIIIRD